MFFFLVAVEIFFFYDNFLKTAGFPCAFSKYKKLYYVYVIFFVLLKCLLVIKTICLIDATVYILGSVVSCDCK